jgi:hypothetical protein
MYNELDSIRSLPACYNGAQYSRSPRATVLGREDPLNGAVCILTCSLFIIQICQIEEFLKTGRITEARPCLSSIYGWR